MTTENIRDFDQDALAWDSFEPRVKLAGDIGDHLLDQIELTPEMDVLDFGCGTGLLSLRMAEQVKTLTGADTSKGMLEVMAGKAADQKRSNVRTLLLDSGNYAPIDGVYDLIISSMVFHHIESIGRMLEQLYAALRPGGQICIADLDLDDGLFHENSTGVFHDGFEREVFCEALSQLGFDDVNVSDATSITKPVGDESRTFTIFLLSGRK